MAIITNPRRIAQLRGDLMAMPMSTRDADARMDTREADAMAEALNVYDHMAGAITSVNYGMNGRVVLRYRILNHLGKFDRDVYTFVFNQGMREHG